MKFALTQKKWGAVVLIYILVFINSIIYSQEKNLSFEVTANLEIVKPEGTFSFERFDSVNQEKTLINIKYQSSSQNFLATIDSQNKSVSFLFLGAELKFYWLNNGFYQVKVHLADGRSAVVTIDQTGLPQNPNALECFSNLLQSVIPSFNSCANSFLDFGVNNGLWQRGYDGSLSVNVQNLRDEYLVTLLQPYGMWGCVVAVIGLVVATVVMIIACASGVGCLLGVIGQKIAIVSMILACFAPEA